MAWSKVQIQNFYKRKLSKEKSKGDEARVREMTRYAKEGTGGGAGRSHLQEPVADDIEPGDVDPRLLTGVAPVFDSLSLVSIPTESSMFRPEDRSSIGFTQVAPTPRACTVPTSTVTSGAYEAQSAATNAQSTFTGRAAAPAEAMREVMVDVSYEGVNWAQNFLNNSDISLPSPRRTGPLLLAACSTPVRATPNSSFDSSVFSNTMSSGNLSPIIGVSRSLVNRLPPMSASVTTPPAAAAPTAATPAVAPIPAAPIPAAPIPAAPIPAAPIPAAPIPAAPIPAAPIPAAPIPADAEQNRRRRRRAPVPPPTAPKGTEALAEMAVAKSRLDKSVSDENIRLSRLSHMATVLAAQQQALYWASKREELAADRLAKGQIVSEQFKNIVTGDCPLMNGDLAVQINLVRGDGERQVILMVMQIGIFFPC